MSDIVSKRFRRNWIRFTANFIKFRYMDGIYLEVLEIVAKESKQYHEVTEFVKETASHFHQELPGSQISFHIPWSPHCKNERCYDFLAISKACDILFVASYDVPNDLRDGCVARSNAPYHRVLSGMLDYIKLGIDSRKLVMGVAWYGYDYTCKHFLGVGECELETISQGVPCSYTEARQIPYKDIMQLLLRSLTGRFWDDDRKAPYFVYLVGNTYHEVWYDDPESISMKVSIMMKLNLRGIGVWAANNIHYAGDVRARMQAAEMWNAVCRPWWNYQV
ncbi:di-N-acetylchitobiase-like [Hypanus sabinus]|uniref:di-N-acetylchitobiase-like n=1 Tax=Hypanus sabinus TaxID=79690 RepID=UPI0028C41E32|nr:di-N-acetylchitobiase-like [Hypanus sabinus]